MIPGSVMYVYIGSFARELSTIGTLNQPATSETKIAQWIIRTCYGYRNLLCNAAYQKSSRAKHFR
jgi:hypothetical protein